MTNLLQRSLAEVIGTFFLCFAGVAAICSAALLEPTHGAGLVGIALAHGLALAIGISALGKVSGGHFNPAVSAATVATGHLHPLAGIAYIVSQVVGGLLGGLACRLAFSEVFPTGSIVNAYDTVTAGVPLPHPSLSVGTILLLEAIGTFLLVTAVYGTAIDPKAPRIGGFGIGLTVAFDVLAFGPMTGASMNPARNLGPALAALGGAVGDKVWTFHVLYWIGPIVGGVIAGLVYKTFFLTPPEPEAVAAA